MLYIPPQLEPEPSEYRGSRVGRLGGVCEMRGVEVGASNFDLNEDLEQTVRV